MATIATIRGNLDTELQAVVTAGTLKSAAHGRDVDDSGMPFARYYYDGFTDDPRQGGGGNITDWFPSHRYVVEIFGDFASGFYKYLIGDKIYYIVEGNSSYNSL